MSGHQARPRPPGGRAVTAEVLRLPIAPPAPDEAQQRRHRALELATRCMQIASLVDAVLLCQVADVLIAYLATGQPVIEAAPPHRALN